MKVEGWWRTDIAFLAAPHYARLPLLCKGKGLWSATWEYPHRRQPASLRLELPNESDVLKAVIHDPMECSVRCPELATHESGQSSIGGVIDAVLVEGFGDLPGPPAHSSIVDDSDRQGVHEFLGGSAGVPIQHALVDVSADHAVRLAFKKWGRSQHHLRGSPTTKQSCGLGVIRLRGNDEVDR